jgi:hypothetical protein
VIDFVTRLTLDPLYEISIALADGRTLDQNAKLWPMLKNVSEQVNWYGHWLKPDEWKDVFSASLKAELKVVPTIQGTGFVVLGLRTSKMSKKKFADLIEFIYAFGAEQNVVWSEKAVASYELLRRAA